MQFSRTHICDVCSLSLSLPLPLSSVVSLSPLLILSSMESHSLSLSFVPSLFYALAISHPLCFLSPSPPIFLSLPLLYALSLSLSLSLSSSLLYALSLSLSLVHFSIAGSRHNKRECDALLSLSLSLSASLPLSLSSPHSLFPLSMLFSSAPSLSRSLSLAPL